MTNDNNDQPENVITSSNNAFAFKTVYVPKHLLDEFNIGREERTLQLRFTVAENVEVTEDTIREFMSKIDAIRASTTTPPTTGMPRMTLVATSVTTNQK